MLEGDVHIPSDLLLKLLELRSSGLELLERLDGLAIVVQRLIRRTV
jgi:hypothetical protein